MRFHRSWFSLFGAYIIIVFALPVSGAMRMPKGVETNYLNPYQLLKKPPTEDPERWMRFHASLQQVPKTIKKIIGKEVKNRKYTLSNGLHFYWVYPDEIFPPLIR